VLGFPYSDNDDEDYTPEIPSFIAKEVEEATKKTKAVE
jgi:hypothetical protein